MNRVTSVIVAIALGTAATMSMTKNASAFMLLGRHHHRQVHHRVVHHTARNLYRTHQRHAYNTNQYRHHG